MAWSSFLCSLFFSNGISDTVAAVLAVYGVINLSMSVARFVRRLYGPPKKEKPYEVNVNIRIVEIKKETKL